MSDRLLKVQELSTCESDVETKPLNKQDSEKKENILSNEKVIDLHKLVRIIKKNTPESIKNKKTLIRRIPQGSEVIKKKCALEKTKLLGSTLLHQNQEVGKFFKEHSSTKILQDDNSAHFIMQNESQKIWKNKLMGNTKNNNNSENVKKLPFKLKKRESFKLNENLTDSKYHKFITMKKNKVNEKQLGEEFFHNITPSLEESMRHIRRENFYEPLSHQEHSYQKIINFQEFTEYVSFYTKAVYLLHSSLDIYITNDNVLQGFELMKNYRAKNIWNYIAANENLELKEVYNTLLHGLSEKGFWGFMQEVIKWMEFDHIKLNCENFSALFYCLINVKESGNEKLVNEQIHKLMKLLFVNNITLNDIFNKTVLTKEKGEKILAFIQQVLPSFDIQPITINLNSDCPLTKNLLLTNNNLESPVDNVGLETMKNMVEEQLLLEDKFMIEVKAVSRGYPSESPEISKKKLIDLKKTWRKCLEEALQRFLDLNIPNPQKRTLHLFLNALPMETTVNIMMEMALSLMEFSKGYSPSTLQSSLVLSNRIFHCYQVRKKFLNKNIERTKNLYEEYTSWYINPHGPARNSRHKWQMLIQNNNKASQLDSYIVNWPEDIKVVVGRFLLELIIKELKFPLKRNDSEIYYPVLCTVLRFRERLWREEIKCHPLISSLFQKVGFDVLFFRADQMPMVCPPKPWKSVKHGGYLFLPTDFIRKPSHIPGKILKLKELSSQDMYPVFDALNALQAIPWMVNEEVLDVAIEVFRSGGSKELNVPHFPMPIEYNNNKNTSCSTFDQRITEQMHRKKMIKKSYDDYGLWCDTLYRLSLANHFRKRLFWLPQNCDFRGRVYPVPALLNHLGADLYRSLLVFAKGKPLGPKGLDWLKVHLINLTGSHKREPVSERLAYANEIIPLIIDSAEKPLTGSKWWFKSDEPWQTLATCMEIKKVLSSPNPENYVCRFPVHQDGSCNGLQHYAGLGKDLIGAESVNLKSTNKPQDVYSVVATLIEEERIKDAKKGIKVASKLEGFVERKVVKQTVMTTVYGVTYYGAKLQISKKLEELPNFPKEYVNPAAAYLADKTFLCLRKMFTSAKEIQEWFLKCADAITSVNDYVQWVSPLGLPILQSYGKARSDFKFNRNIILPDRMKQKNAFPPNFIHSLDSSHMMLTALFCEQAGVTFAAVHDCFWTHPATVDMMNKICREQFISLHSQPILEDLSRFFVKQYVKNNADQHEDLTATFEAYPAKGCFDLKEILNSVYFFS